MELLKLVSIMFLCLFRRFEIRSPTSTTLLIRSKNPDVIPTTLRAKTEFPVILANPSVVSWSVFYSKRRLNAGRNVHSALETKSGNSPVLTRCVSAKLSCRTTSVSEPKRARPCSSPVAIPEYLALKIGV